MLEFRSCTRDLLTCIEQVDMEITFEYFFRLMWEVCSVVCVWCVVFFFPHPIQVAESLKRHRYSCINVAL